MKHKRLSRLQAALHELAKNKQNIEANNGTTQNKYKTATKLNEPVPRFSMIK